uniref:Glycosyltransferase 6 domain containing 1 n=1 Tax=Suricata suricatta TaxID=37032 RepID=A0A673TYM5_SURSU
MSCLQLNCILLFLFVCFVFCLLLLILLPLLLFLFINITCYHLEDNICCHNKWFFLNFFPCSSNRKRPDVKTTTDWFAPIIWEGTYNRQVLEKYYKKLNITIGLAVFATGKFVDQDLQQFLQSANKHFMIGFRSPLSIKLCAALKQPVWKDFNYIYMENLDVYITEHIQHEVNFLFSMTVNQVFKNDFGVETLGKSVAQLHAWWYFRHAENFPYERRPKSAAFIPFGEGDFYYHSAIFGGTPHEVVAFIKEYQKGVTSDNRNGLKSIYEHYLNKYLFINKPTKLLSPEHNWDPNFRTPPQIKHVKIAWHSKSI